MTIEISPGTCLVCKAPLMERNTLKHSIRCLQKAGWPTGEEPSFLIAIRGQDDRNYWLIALARHDALLGDLDQMIRDVWMGCDGHPGSFLIDEVIYESEDEDSSDAMEVPLSEVISPGEFFTYNYGLYLFTSLDLEVVGETPVVPPAGPICLIARNNQPAIPCDICGDEAGLVLSEFDDEVSLYYCQECLSSIDHDPDCVDIITNSPRTGVWDYYEDPVAAHLWYPPGWTVSEIAPERPGDEVEVEALVTVIMEEFGSDIDEFVEAEASAHGEKGAHMARDTVIAFCMFMQAVHGQKIGAWDVSSAQECLVEHLSEKPIFPKSWPKSAVPILCRFLRHMEAAGHVTNASELIDALKKAEPAFQKAAVNPEKSQALFEYILKEAASSGIDMNDLDEVFLFIAKRVTKLSGIELDSKDLQKEIANIFMSQMLDINDE